MTSLLLDKNPAVAEKFQSYPLEIRLKMDHLRDLILQVARESETIAKLEETLKWGEPSYLTQKGSTLRIDWKAKSPDQYAMYFKCTSLLVPTIKTIYGALFKYEKNRAILFDLNENIPKNELKVCIGMALHYHQLKHLPLLGQ